jgi:hypothetical protein
MLISELEVEIQLTELTTFISTLFLIDSRTYESHTYYIQTNFLTAYLE